MAHRAVGFSKHRKLSGVYLLMTAFAFRICILVLNNFKPIDGLRFVAAAAFRLCMPAEEDEVCFRMIKTLREPIFRRVT
jgi:hypothetical protein